MGKKELLTAVAAGALAMGISTAKAADIEPVAQPSWYVSLFGGVSWLEDVKTDYQFDGNDGDYKADIETNTGFIVGGAIGTHLMDDLRVELEVAYTQNSIDQIKYDDAVGIDSGTYDASGKFGIVTFMANLWYDVPLSEDVTPYIGGGAGLAIVDGDPGYDVNSDFDPIFKNSEVAFAFQVGAGLRWHVWENVALDVGYRLRGIDGPEFSSEVTQIPGTSDYDADWIFSHNVIAGVSFGF
jgi:opacity protein-like surface antigen